MILLQDCPESLLSEPLCRTLEIPECESVLPEESLPEGELQRWLDLCG